MQGGPCGFADERLVVPIFPCPQRGCTVYYFTFLDPSWWEACHAHSHNFRRSFPSHSDTRTILKGKHFTAYAPPVLTSCVCVCGCRPRGTVQKYFRTILSSHPLSSYFSSRFSLFPKRDFYSYGNSLCCKFSYYCSLYIMLSSTDRRV